MKRLFILLFICLFGFLSLSAQAFQKAEEAYINGNYDEAINLYEEALSEGESSELYYNLGNAYYKKDEIASAILNYERALLLAPGNGDIRFNLEMSKTKLTDRIEPIETFFLVKWYHDLQDVQSSNGWAKTGVLFFVLLIACLFLFFFSKVTVFRKISFFAGLVFIVVILFTNIFAFNQKNKLSQKKYAIVFEPAVTVKSSPRPDGKELFVIHEGIKVYIKSTLNDWGEIELEDGNVGWIPLSMIERI